MSDGNFTDGKENVQLKIELDPENAVRWANASQTAVVKYESERLGAEICFGLLPEAF